ncbi:MAG: FAD-dependent oxidoreductase [Methanobacteriota archaeon]|nr:MAG: FAD-dependent oxidoreductase [Euryarchaeota archaeon]
MQQDLFDVLVIGGGIVGVGIARDAARRGFRTALADRGDFASGTSGKTSRLIHGGLRYLQDYKVGLVRLAVRERDRLLETAPGLIHPLPFVIPAYRGRSPGPILLRFGLFLYDLLSKKTLPRRVWLRPDAASDREPRLSRADLAGAGLYYDAWTDDARFVLAVVREAAREGAEVSNHVEVTDLIRENDRVVGAHLRDRIDGSAFEVRARGVVNREPPCRSADDEARRSSRLRPPLERPHVGRDHGHRLSRGPEPGDAGRGRRRVSVGCNERCVPRCARGPGRRRQCVCRSSPAPAACHRGSIGVPCLPRARGVPGPGWADLRRGGQVHDPSGDGRSGRRHGRSPSRREAAKPDVGGRLRPSRPAPRGIPRSGFRRTGRPRAPSPIRARASGAICRRPGSSRPDRGGTAPRVGGGRHRDA